MSSLDSTKTAAFMRQKAEFDAVSQLAKCWREQPAIVDDYYPEWRFYYERNLFALVLAVKANQPERFKIETGT